MPALGLSGHASTLLQLTARSLGAEAREFSRLLPRSVWRAPQAGRLSIASTMTVPQRPQGDGLAQQQQQRQGVATWDGASPPTSPFSPFAGFACTCLLIGAWLNI